MAQLARGGREPRRAVGYLEIKNWVRLPAPGPQAYFADQSDHAERVVIVCRVAVQTIPFDFITDEGLRDGLGSDYREMIQCAEVGSWKAVHLLAGSIVEAVLVDHLVGTAKQKKPDPMSMGMADLISAGKKAGVMGK